jgi:hypothetical protein
MVLTSCVRMRPSFIRDWTLNIEVRSSTNVILNAGFWRMPIFGAMFKKVSSPKHGTNRKVFVYMSTLVYF